MDAPIAHGSSWASRLLALLTELAAARRADDALRGETWSLLNTALFARLQHQASLLGRVDRAELQDIAAEKALDLFRRAESGVWDVTGRGPAELAGFLSRTARNGLVDHLRRSGRSMGIDDETRLDALIAGDGNPAPHGRRAPTASAPAEGAEFARALAACVGALKERARTIWIFRAFYEMSSKEIARHPEVGLTPGNVDVILQRSRNALGECMRRKGFEPGDLPAGAFVEIWTVFRERGGGHVEGTSDDG